MITSATLYFDCEKYSSIPLEWFERVQSWFEQHSLSPILFTAEGRDFRLDDCHELKDRQEDLLEALRNGNITSLTMDSPRPGSQDREDWRANADLSLIDGTIYLGMDETIVANPIALLHEALGAAKQLFDVRYGIGYSMPLSHDPGSYSIGFRGSSLADIEADLKEAQHQQTPDELWQDELMDQRRHLETLFRGAYQANVLSEGHVRVSDLTNRKIGRLTELNSTLWLWELSEQEIPEAEAMLAARNLLVSQARV